LNGVIGVDRRIAAAVAARHCGVARGAIRAPLAAPGEVAWIAGAGYLTGAFLLTLWMRALSQVGVRFGVLPIALPLGLVALALGDLAWRRHGGAPVTEAGRSALRALIAPPGLAGAARIVWQLALAWLALRYALLGLLVDWQPLYPWDAWIQWATKARVWYELGQIVPFVRSEAWYATGGAAWFDASPEYPPTVPLLQVWSCVALGRWDDALMNWPWWQLLRGIDARHLRRAAVARRAGARRARRRVHRRDAAARQRPRCARRLRGPPDGPTTPAPCWLSCAGAQRVIPAGRSRTAARRGLHADQIRGSSGRSPSCRGSSSCCCPGKPRSRDRPPLAPFVLAVLAQTHPVVFNYRLHLDFDPAWRALGETHFLLQLAPALVRRLAAALLAWRQLASPSLRR
jgi:hypothetical protein